MVLAPPPCFQLSFVSVLLKLLSSQSILRLPTTPPVFAQRSFHSAAGHKTSFLTTSSLQLTVFLGL